MVESWKERYSDLVENKIVSLPMSFNFDQFQKLNRKEHDNKKLCICHIGNLYRLRRADTFLKALASLIDESSEIKNKIEVFFVGKMPQDDIDLISELHLETIVKAVGKLTESECIEYYEKADVFLVIESTQQGKLFFPSKLIRYYFYGKPIIGLTCEGSVLYNRLQKNGHFAYTPNDIDGVKEYVKTAVNQYSSLLGFNMSAWREFDAGNVALLYSELFK
jgi:glycosyltransferase involved in cell wall biosynthesis